MFGGGGTGAADYSGSGRGIRVTSGAGVRSPRALTPSPGTSPRSSGLPPCLPPAAVINRTARHPKEDTTTAPVNVPAQPYSLSEEERRWAAATFEGGGVEEEEGTEEEGVETVGEETAISSASSSSVAPAVAGCRRGSAPARIALTVKGSGVERSAALDAGTGSGGYRISGALRSPRAGDPATGGGYAGPLLQPPTVTASAAAVCRPLPSFKSLYIEAHHPSLPPPPPSHPRMTTAGEASAALSGLSAVAGPDCFGAVAVQPPVFYPSAKACALPAQSQSRGGLSVCGRRSSPRARAAASGWGSQLPSKPPPTPVAIATEASAGGGGAANTAASSVHYLSSEQ